MPQSAIHARNSSYREGRTGLGAGFIPEIVVQWPRILVRDTTVIPAAGDASYRTVRACIDLGSLLPADVRVALVPIHDSGPDFTAAHLMWSTESYHNGTYRYEVTVPEAAVGDGTCVLRVAPTRDLPLWRDILAVIQVPISCGSRRTDAPVPRS